MIDSRKFISSKVPKEPEGDVHLFKKGNWTGTAASAKTFCKILAERSTERPFQYPSRLIIPGPPYPVSELLLKNNKPSSSLVVIVWCLVSANKSSFNLTTQNSSSYPTSAVKDGAIIIAIFGKLLFYLTNCTRKAILLFLCKLVSYIWRRILLCVFSCSSKRISTTSGDISALYCRLLQC